MYLFIYDYIDMIVMRYIFFFLIIIPLFFAKNCTAIFQNSNIHLQEIMEIQTE